MNNLHIRHYETRIAVLRERGKEVIQRLKEIEKEKEELSQQLENIENAIKSNYDKKDKAEV